MFIVVNKNIYGLDSRQISSTKRYWLSTETFQCRYMNDIIINIANIVGILDIIAWMIKISWHPSSQPRWEAHQSWFLYFRISPHLSELCYSLSMLSSCIVWTMETHERAHKGLDKRTQTNFHRDNTQDRHKNTRVQTRIHIFPRMVWFFTGNQPNQQGYWNWMNGSM